MESPLKKGERIRGSWRDHIVLISGRSEDIAVGLGLNWDWIQ